MDDPSDVEFSVGELSVTGLLMVDVEMIADDPARYPVREETVRSMIATLARGGILDPVVGCVMPGHLTMYVLLDGVHRLRATQAFGLTQIAMYLVTCDEARLVLERAAMNQNHGDSLLAARMFEEAWQVLSEPVRALIADEQLLQGQITEEGDLIAVPVVEPLPDSGRELLTMLHAHVEVTRRLGEARPRAEALSAAIRAWFTVIAEMFAQRNADWLVERLGLANLGLEGGERIAPAAIAARLALVGRIVDPDVRAEFLRRLRVERSASSSNLLAATRRLGWAVIPDPAGPGRVGKQEVLRLLTRNSFQQLAARYRARDWLWGPPGPQGPSGAAGSPAGGSSGDEPRSAGAEEAHAAGSAGPSGVKPEAAPAPGEPRQMPTGASEQIIGQVSSEWVKPERNGPARMPQIASRRTKADAGAGAGTGTSPAGPSTAGADLAALLAALDACLRAVAAYDRAGGRWDHPELQLRLSALGRQVAAHRTDH